MSGFVDCACAWTELLLIGILFLCSTRLSVECCPKLVIERRTVISVGYTVYDNAK